MARKEVAALDDAHLRRAGFVYIAALFAALGGLLFGYDTSVISGALLFIKREFGLTTAAEEIVVSGVLFGASIGAIVGGKAADRFGRRRVLLVTAAIFGIGALASAVAPSPDRQPSRSRFGDWPRFNKRSGLSVGSRASAREGLGRVALSTCCHCRHRRCVLDGLRFCWRRGLEMDARPGRRSGPGLRN